MSALLLDQPDLTSMKLTRAEYELIVDRLGRQPTQVELGIFEVLWSEHCSYKSSRSLLKQLPGEGMRVLQAQGENAGAVDIGHGLAAVFKVESHNHPSAVEPYQGAATGVGGILRDVMAMGARPIALLDSLHFGPLPEGWRYLQGVVAGVGGYGNCMGIPTVGGEIWFDSCYIGNPLVNAMCVGVVPINRLQRAAATGEGNRLLLVGADTGCDGINAASFASTELDESIAEQRPIVQVGNPFLEKCLLEACQEVLELPGIVAIQDLGAGGLSSAVAECASRGGLGARLDVHQVSRRTTGMNAYQVMLSESQERMLLVVEPDSISAAEAIFKRWELSTAVIGEITSDGQLTVTEGEWVIVQLPLNLLTKGVPTPRLKSTPPKPSSEASPPASRRPTESWSELLVRLLGTANLCSRKPIFRQYDHMVGNATVVPPGGDAAVLRVSGTPIGLAVTLDSCSRYSRLDPYLGAQIAVCEAAHNLLATGARPLAVTDCLNLGNPEREEIYWQLEQTIAGIAATCRALGLPVVSGNVSLYNESPHGSVDPTPVIGMVGLLENYQQRLSAGFQSDGDFAVLVGETHNQLGGSEYSRLVGNLEATEALPTLDLDHEIRLREFMLAAVGAELLTSAHDVSEGGLLVALAESCLLGERGISGAAWSVPEGLSLEALFFGESQGRMIVSVHPRSMPELQSLARSYQLELSLLGLIGGDRIEIRGQVQANLAELRQSWENGLERKE